MYVNGNGNFFCAKKNPQVNAVSGLLEVTGPSTGDSALMLVRINADRGRQCRVTALAGADCGLIFRWTLIHCNLKIGGRHYDGTENADVTLCWFRCSSVAWSQRNATRCFRHSNFLIPIHSMFSEQLGRRILFWFIAAWLLFVFVL